MADAALAEDEVRSRLGDHPGWSFVDGKLHRELEFGDFAAAFSFMTAVALAAEKLDHHPDWSNSWNKVTIDVVSHAAGGVTATCFDLVARIDKAAASA
jgi:4a-hydroxytetrahydrobiopterin dehydratase